MREGVSVRRCVYECTRACRGEVVEEREGLLLVLHVADPRPDAEIDVGVMHVV
jgi:hypothetical protein